jgi:nucleoside-diphosphate-sugar epimerase
MHTHEKKLHIIITGATGYIGRQLTLDALLQGWKVTALARRSPPFENVDFIPFDLSKPIEKLPDDAEAIFHLAANTSGITMDKQAEFTCAEQLAYQAKQQGMRFIFVSSQAAASDAPTDYGRSKWKIEQMVIANGGIVIRPGLVYGGHAESGLYKTLLDQVARYYFIPMLMPSPQVKPIHIQDLTNLLIAIAKNPSARSQEYNICSEKPLAFNLFMQSLARYRLRCIRIPIPIPTYLLNKLIYIAGKLNRNFSSLANRFDSLLKLKPMQLSSHIKNDFGIELRTLPDGLHASGSQNRRLLAREAILLMRYTTGQRPSISSIASYIRCIEALFQGEALALPFPALIRLKDCGSLFLERDFCEKKLNHRLSIAITLTENTPEAKDCFKLKKNMPFIIAILKMSFYLSLEVTTQILQFILLKSTRAFWKNK